MTNKNSNQYDEIDLRIFLRNKKLIVSFSFIGFILACIYALTLKRVWEGEFQIVLETDSKQFNLPFNLDSRVLKASGLDRLNSKSNTLSTEVGILRSPSVLMPTFEFLYASKRKIDPDFDLIFSKWKKIISVLN